MANVVGEIGKEDKVLVVRRIIVTYELCLAADQNEIAKRTHKIHANYCPLARTISNCVDIQTELNLIEKS